MTAAANAPLIIKKRRSSARKFPTSFAEYLDWHPKDSYHYEWENSKNRSHDLSKKNSHCG
jgi:hypothetical protein